MTKKGFIFLAILLVFISGLWAGGRRDANESRVAEDPSGFTDTIDTVRKKPGTWNYYIEARDRAGNRALSGPENIFIDPESDLPVTTIINPTPFMHVQGNLNIVGLAFDDDGVEKVELIVTRGTDGRGEELVSVTAAGGDYWSYFLDTTDPEIWTDGNYTITAWATDVTGLSGIADEFPNGTKVKPKQHKRAVVYWTLDRKKPETIVSSHGIGALVRGNIRLFGTVSDGNGINSLSYSVDGGNKYLPAKIKEDKRTGEYTWEVNIDTRILESGPSVFWFRAEDGKGSIGTAAHLLFINNTRPDVAIVYPEPTATVNGLFSIAGYAKHPVGLNSLTWRAGGESGTIDLIPGNHWWSADIDLRGQDKLTSIDIEVQATDVSGNTTVLRQRYRVDQMSDRPTVTLTAPVPGTLNNEAGLVVKGFARDDDGVASIFYSLNNSLAVEIPCTGNFQFRIPEIPPGNNSLDVWAKDVHGILGPRAQVRGIVVPETLIQPSISSIQTGAARTAIVTPYHTGMTVKPVPIINVRTMQQTGIERFTMNVAFRASAAPVSASIIFGEGVPIPLRLTASAGVFTAAVPVPDLYNGLNKVQLTAMDRSGREVLLEEYFYFSGLEGEDRLPFEFSLLTDNYGRPKTLPDGSIIIGEAGESILGISSIPLTNVTVSGTGSANISAEVDHHGRAVITALAEGNHGPLTLRLMDENGSITQSPAFRVIADFTGPVVTMQGMAQNQWVQNTANNVRFNVSSRNRVTAVEYSLNMGETWVSFGQIASDYTRNIDLTGTEDGSVSILIRARNESGKVSIADYTVLKDTTFPLASLVMPVTEASVNGTIRLAFSIEEAGEINTITYSRPARPGVPALTTPIYSESAWDKNYPPKFIEVLMDAATIPLDENMRFTFTDKAGNAFTVSTWDFIIDRESDIPTAHIILPLDNEVVTSDFIISGVMFDDDGIKNVQYRINNNPWQTIDAENGFYIPVALTSLTDNEHSVTVIAEDIFGVRSAPVTRNFRVSLSEPAATVVFPQVSTILRDEIEIRGTAFDRNGISDLKVSLDNGSTFNSVRDVFGTPAQNVTWSYRFNTRILKDGAHVLFIRVWDRYGIPATYANMINVDNTAPEIVLDSPLDGSRSTGTLNVMGRILDPNLSEVEIQLRGLEGQQIPPNLRDRKVEPNAMLRESYNLTALADGYYDLTVVGKDSAGNVSRLSSNFELARRTFQNTIQILYPLENEEVSGYFNLYGVTSGADPAGTVTIRVNGMDAAISPVDENGFFRFSLDSEFLRDGENNIMVHSNFGGSAQVQSRPYVIRYALHGPWVTVTSFAFGDFAYDRPYIYGNTGYVLSEEDTAALADRSTDRETRAVILAKTPDYTEISFDNGKSFTRTEKGRKGIDYRYRLETGEMPEGIHYIVIRTVFKNSETAVTRMMVSVDKTLPEIRLISPEMGGRYNTEIAFSASATDDVELVSLSYHLRVGDKAFYAVPGFLQGLYFEAIIPPFLKQLFNNLPVIPFGGGATYMDAGLGLSFFEDNVKLQLNYGFMFQDLYESMGGEGAVRYGGHILGLKLLANIYTLPFISVWGPDWEWLYMSIAVGANFSLFDITQEGYTQSGKRTWMSALLLQIELPKIVIPKRENFRQFSLFTEGQLWFVPTDVDADQLGIATILPKIVFGLRFYIF